MTYIKNYIIDIYKGVLNNLKPVIITTITGLILSGGFLYQKKHNSSGNIENKTHIKAEKKQFNKKNAKKK